MKRADRFLIGACCVVLLMISWIVAANSKSTAVKQLELIQQAAGLMEDGIFILAVPLLEEAAGYNAAYTSAAEEELKRAYLALIDNRGFSRKYTGLLDKQMGRRDASPEVFAEAAGYYLGVSRTQDALEVLKAGIARTGSPELIALYESSRYAYEMNRTSYEYVGAIYGNTVQVQNGGLWGIARADGVLLIPCMYERISTFSGDRAVVKKDGEIYAVNRNNNRVAKLSGMADDIGNFANNRIPVFTEGVWRRATGELELGASAFQQMGMYSGGYAAAKSDEKWGVIGIASDWLVPALYDEIILDELGRCYAQGAVFARMGEAVYLLVGGRQVGDAYEDARPFPAEGYAAVKRGGKWGFIDTSGTVKIDFVFDDALSFGQHLAAVRQGELWGYISVYGNIVIEPAFEEAKSFSNGSAPVLTGHGWQFIMLLEYKKVATL
jgi:hypothetical protein